MTNATPARIPTQRHLFDIPDEVAYLNCAYMGPLMHPVVEAGDRGIRAKARPWGILPDDFFAGGERARELFARIIGADAEGGGAGSVRELRALVRGAQPRGAAGGPARGAGRAVPVQRLRMAGGRAEPRGLARDGVPSRGRRLDPGGARRDRRANRRRRPPPLPLDRRRAARSRADRRPVPRGGRRARAGPHPVGRALGFDAGEVRPDYVVCAGYKWLLGPYSLGFLWAAPEHRGGKPIEYNWIARAGGGGLRAPRRLPRRVPAGRAPLRRGGTLELHPGADAERRPRPDSRMGGSRPSKRPSPPGPPTSPLVRPASASARRRPPFAPATSSGCASRAAAFRQGFSPPSRRSRST